MSQPPDPAPAPARPRRQAHPWRDSSLLIGALLLAAGGVGAYLYFFVYKAVEPLEFSRTLRQGLALADKLDPAYSPDGDSLVAAAPADAAKLVDPPRLVLGVFENDLAAYKDFASRLKQKTGKEVDLVAVPVSGKEAAAELKAGKLHVLALSTGAVPLAVNQAGAVPFAAVADEQGRFGYHMEVVVRADSPVKGLKDLRGKKLHLGSFSSLSSFKGPLVLLWQKEKMLPERDYEFVVTRNQVDSIKGILSGEFEAAAVAGDLLRRVEAEERAKAQKAGQSPPKDAYRTIYRSEETYPPLCFAHAHDLNPELAKRVREAFLEASFRFAGTSLEAAYARANQTRFAPVDYKRDWQAVREIDRQLLALTEGK